MAFKATASKAPASPALYKAEANKLFGIDSTTSDDNVSLGRACGVSYFDVERANERGIGDSSASPAPGLCNFIRTNYGEIGKRRGAKPVNVIDAPGRIVEIIKVISFKNLTMLCTFDAVDGTNHTDFYSAIHFMIYKDGEYTDTVVYVFLLDFAQPFNFAAITDEKIVIFSEDCIIFGETQEIISGNFSSLVRVYSGGFQTIYELSENSYLFTDAVQGYEDYGSAKIYTPTVHIGGIPAGGSGKTYEPINIINPWVKELFQGNGSTATYALSSTPDTGTQPIAYILSSNGTWTKTSVSWNGLNVKFSSAPGKPVITGEDNVMICYKYASHDMSRITDCTVFCNFGVGGYKDRLFVSGNSSHPNYVWYSAMDDYTYFPDLGYLTFSDSACTVKALAGQDTSLAVITDDKCYLVSGTVNSGTDDDFSPDALFLVSHVFESAKPVGYTLPLVFNNEVVYMSEVGLAAITPSNIMDERYTQVRSERVSGWLLDEDLADLQCCVCGEFFVINNRKGRMYLLDGAQFSSTESKPFSYRQYEAFIWELQADFIWDMNGEIFFIKDKYIYRVPFVTEAENDDYADNFWGYVDSELTLIPEPVRCYWETPNIYGGDFYNRKAFSKLGVLIRKMINPTDNLEVNTAIRIWAKKDSKPWKLVKDYDGDQSIFRYDYLNYDIFSYRNTVKKYAIDKKIKFKKTYGLKLRFENDIEGMPLYLQAFGLEYSK